MKKAANATPNSQLIEERLKRHWTQLEVAQRVGTTTVNVSRWEHGISSPGAYFRNQLCSLYEKSAEELALVSKARSESSTSILSKEMQPAMNISTAPPLLWNVPYRRNPFFTGRADILEQLHDALCPGTATPGQVYALSGLGGIGKTQSALEYAYRYREAYCAALWVRADSRENLLVDFVAIAEMMHLYKEREMVEHDQSRSVELVKRWLHGHACWLLILDNAENLVVINEFLPSTHNGYVLLTTRSQITGTLAQRIGIEKMSQEEGALFLLRRSRRIEPAAILEDAAETLCSPAREIAQIMDGLPLALDQAGAYIEETLCSVSDYLTRYRSRSLDLLKLRGELVTDHPASVPVTFSLSFEKVERINPHAAELLRLCAFLHPDVIPEEVLERTSDPLLFDSAIKALRTFSLLQRYPATKSFTMHRLVQVSLRDGMDEETQRLWAEYAVRAVNRAFPTGEFATWQRCQQFLPHVQVCAALISQWNLVFPEAAHLLLQEGRYVYEHASFYTQAEPLLQQALSIYEQILEPVYQDVAQCLTCLGRISYEQGKLAQAESFFQKALTLYEQALGSAHPDVAHSLTHLVMFYLDQGSYHHAQPFIQRALHIYDQFPGSSSLQAAQNLNTLAIACYHQGHYAQSESFFQRVLAIREQALEPGDPTLAESFLNLGAANLAQEKYAQARLLFQRALFIHEQSLNAGHPMIGVDLNSLALISFYLGQYEEAECLFQQALSIREQALGPESSCFAEILNNLADLYRVQERYAQAEQYCQRALVIYKKVWGEEHLEIAQVYCTMAKLYYVQEQYAQAEPFFQLAQSIRKQMLGLEHPTVIRGAREWDVLKSRKKITS